MEAHFARFSSSISDEEKAVRALGAQPLVYNPLWIARLGAVYQPIYGKFVIGSAIQHFKVGVRAGLHAALERVLQDAPTSSGRRTQVVYGPEVGSYLEFPVFKTTSFTLETDLLAHREIDVQSSPSGIRKIWTFALGVGFRL